MLLSPGQAAVRWSQFAGPLTALDEMDTVSPRIVASVAAGLLWGMNRCTPAATASERHAGQGNETADVQIVLARDCTIVAHGSGWPRMLVHAPLASFSVASTVTELSPGSTKHAGEGRQPPAESNAGSLDKFPLENRMAREAFVALHRIGNPVNRLDDVR